MNNTRFHEVGRNGNGAGVHGARRAAIDIPRRVERTHSASTRKTLASRESRGWPAPRTGWKSALRGGLGLCFLLLAALGICHSAISARAPARSARGSVHAMGFAPAGFEGRGVRAAGLAALFPVPDEIGAPRLAAAGDRALDPSRAQEGPAPRAAEPGASVDEAAASRPSVSQDPARALRGIPVRGEDSTTGPGAHESGVKRRTSVAVAMTEEKIARAAGPRRRVIVQDATPTFQPRSAYPEAALKQEKEGLVRARFKISATGGVERLEIVEASPPGFFENAVEEAVKQWRYAPALDQFGKPIESWDDFDFQFKLARPGS